MLLYHRSFLKYQNLAPYIKVNIPPHPLSSLITNFKTFLFCTIFIDCLCQDSEIPLCC